MCASTNVRVHRRSRATRALGRRHKARGCPPVGPQQGVQAAAVHRVPAVEPRAGLARVEHELLWGTGDRRTSQLMVVRVCPTVHGVVSCEAGWVLTSRQTGQSLRSMDGLHACLPWKSTSMHVSHLSQWCMFSRPPTLGGTNTSDTGHTGLRSGGQAVGLGSPTDAALVAVVLLLGAVVVEEVALATEVPSHDHATLGTLTLGLGVGKHGTRRG